MLIQNQPFCVVFTLMFKQDFIQKTLIVKPPTKQNKKKAAICTGSKLQSG